VGLVTHLVHPLDGSGLQFHNNSVTLLIETLQVRVA
jgi:hypothetical protein